MREEEKGDHIIDGQDMEQWEKEIREGVNLQPEEIMSFSEPVSAKECGVAMKQFEAELIELLRKYKISGIAAAVGKVAYGDMDGNPEDTGTCVAVTVMGSNRIKLRLCDALHEYHYNCMYEASTRLADAEEHFVKMITAGQSQEDEDGGEFFVDDLDSEMEDDK